MTASAFVIRTPEAFGLAQDRIAEILAAPDDVRPVLAGELTALRDACADWQSATHIGSDATGPVDQSATITSERDYQAAKARMAELIDGGESTGAELAEVSEALEAWEAKQVPGPSPLG